MSSRLSLYLFIHGFPPTLFPSRTTMFYSITDIFQCSKKIQTDWVYYSTQSSLVIQNYFSIDYPFIFSYPNGPWYPLGRLLYTQSNRIYSIMWCLYMNYFWGTWFSFFCQLINLIQKTINLKNLLWLTWIKSVYWW